MSNFAFMPATFADLAAAAQAAESYIEADPRSAAFNTRFALESLVHWLYRHEPGLNVPYQENLGALIHEPSFQTLLGEDRFQKSRLIVKIGNQAAHGSRPPTTLDARQAVRELHHLCYWLVRTYAPDADRTGAAWQDARVPAPAADAPPPVSQARLAELEQQLADERERRLKQQLERDEQDAELQALREALAKVRAESETKPDAHDYSEAETRTYLIDVDLRRAGWPLDQSRDREYEVTGMPNNKGIGYVDYVLWGADGLPLAVVEAKRTTVDARQGRQQALLYANCLEQMHGQRPVIFYTNGYRTWIWDDTTYPPREVAGFYKQDELDRLIRRRTQRQPLAVAAVKDTIVERPYQKRALGSIFGEFAASRRKALLVMATGTGKTRTAIALVDVLQRTGWVKRALFLADRIALVNQAVNAFKQHLPESSPVNLVTEKETQGRVFASTYPTMMGLINERDGDTARFGVGHFDLIIIDEAHRSIYQRYREIFRYFDALLVGLTATPREEVDKNTYDLFDLEAGVPTDAYELDEAVSDEWLVPPRVHQVDLKYPREGISYDDLSDEEKEQWESLDWGDAADGGGQPRQVNATAINNWLFNKDTVDKALRHLMEHGHKVAEGDRLGKTIIFARNHEHAEFIAERFDHHYPHYAGHFARIIDYQVKYPQSLLDDFSIKDKAPHIAISVDMLDTGIDVPEVVNLVFFKPVYSRIKFWQMIGRGTRLCPNLFGPDKHKADFRVFDFCFNFDFFKENPKGIEAGTTASLRQRLFEARVELLGSIQHATDIDEAHSGLAHKLADGLHGEVTAMNPENFIVRRQLEIVERFQQREAWTELGDDDLVDLSTKVAGLPTDADEDKLEARQFDLIALRLQLAVAHNETTAFERYRRRVVEIAQMLEEKSNIPAVKAQLSYLAAVQETVFWDGIDLVALEDLRLRLRDLVQFLDKSKRTIVHSDFEDEILQVRVEEDLLTPRMTGAQFEKKVAAYLTAHRDDLVIHKLRCNEALTPRDLEQLEATLVAIGEEKGADLLAGLLKQQGAPSLVHFVRGMVGMDRTAAQAAFGRFLSDRSLSAPQIRFIELIIDQLTARGVMTASALYEPPFTSVDAGGPDALFSNQPQVIEGIFDALKATDPDSGSASA